MYLTYTDYPDIILRFGLNLILLKYYIFTYTLSMELIINESAITYL